MTKTALNPYTGRPREVAERDEEAALRVALLLLHERGRRNEDQDALDLAEQRRLSYGQPPFTERELLGANLVVGALAAGDEPTLNAVLYLSGLTTEVIPGLRVRGRRKVVRATTGEVVLERADWTDLWPWLADTGRWPQAGGAR